jgi:hypothetical protein
VRHQSLKANEPFRGHGPEITYTFIDSGPRLIAATPVRETSTKPNGTINEMN